MRTICLSAIVAFVACASIWMIGRAIDQVHRDACVIGQVGQTTQTPCP